MKDRVQFITHEGKEILLLNFSDCTVESASPVINDAKPLIRARPEQSLLTLTDVTNMRFNDRVIQEMKEFTVHNKPYVRAAAVIGITGIKRIIVEAVMLFSGRKLHVFDTLEQAKSWLVTIQ